MGGRHWPSRSGKGEALPEAAEAGRLNAKEDQDFLKGWHPPALGTIEILTSVGTIRSSNWGVNSELR